MTSDTYIACPTCDLIHARKPLAHRQVARCTRCDTQLWHEYDWNPQRLLALQVTCLVLFGLVHSFPFIGISVFGIEQETNILRSILSLLQGERLLLAGVVFAALVVAPLIDIIAGIWILLPAATGYKPPRFEFAYRVARSHASWSMLEIYLIGVLVTFVKLAETGRVIVGFSFWAFVALVVLNTTVKLWLDFDRLWDRGRARA